MSLVKVPLKTPNITLYLENHQGLLFHHEQKTLYNLPAHSIALLLLLDDGHDSESAIESVATQTHCSIEQVSALFNALMHFIQSSSKDINYIDGRYPELSQPVNLESNLPKSSCATFKVFSTTFLVSADDRSFIHDLKCLLSPIACEPQKIDVKITLEKETNRYRLLVNDLEVESDLEYKHLMPVVIDRLQILSFQNSPYQYCFHGAAFQFEHGNVLLPGASGAGKSTMCARFASRGFAIYSDEIIALDEHFQLIPLPLPIAIKSGSWSFSEALFPEITQAQTWHRIDGRQLRYVWPQSFASHQDAHSRGSREYIIANPMFTESTPQQIGDTEETQVVQLTIIESVQMLTQSGYQLGFELSEDKLDHLLDFLADARLIKLIYSNGQSAMSTLESMWQKK